MTPSWVKVSRQSETTVLYCEVCGRHQAVYTLEEAQGFSDLHASHYASRQWGGAGDAVHKVANAIGVETCKPCEKRRHWLNRLFPKVWKR